MFLLPMTCLAATAPLGLERTADDELRQKCCNIGSSVEETYQIYECCHNHALVDNPSANCAFVSSVPGIQGKSWAIKKAKNGSGNWKVKQGVKDAYEQCQKKGFPPVNNPIDKAAFMAACAGPAPAAVVEDPTPSRSAPPPDGEGPPKADPPKPGGTGGSKGDPHLRLAHGGTADFRGRDGAWYSLLSAPGVQLAGQTVETDHLLTQVGVGPVLVHGTFFTRVAWTVRGVSGRTYGVIADANRTRFEVFDEAAGGALIASVEGAWQQWWHDGIRVYSKKVTLFVRANGWEVNATRRPVYNFVSGPSHARFDLTLRPLEGDTGFEHFHGAASATCYPHGLIGQSWDGDELGVSGAKDNYTYDVDNAVVTTAAMAEGAIEGAAEDYEVAEPFETSFAYTRFAEDADAECPPRDVSLLTGARRRKAGGASVAMAGSHDGALDDGHGPDAAARKRLSAHTKALLQANATETAEAEGSQSPESSDTAAASHQGRSDAPSDAPTEEEVVGGGALTEDVRGVNMPHRVSAHDQIMRAFWKRASRAALQAHAESDE